MKTTHDISGRDDRYYYDFGPCSAANGFAQIDTGQDASYFGIWANPTSLVIFSYAEGDTTKVECESPEEFATALRDMHEWNVKQGWGGAYIDPGFDPAMKTAFEQMGLAELLH